MNAKKLIALLLALLLALSVVPLALADGEGEAIGHNVQVTNSNGGIKTNLTPADEQKGATVEQDGTTVTVTLPAVEIPSGSGRAVQVASTGEGCVATVAVTGNVETTAETNGVSLYGVDASGRNQGVAAVSAEGVTVDGGGKSNVRAYGAYVNGSYGTASATVGEGGVSVSDVSNAYGVYANSSGRKEKPASATVLVDGDVDISNVGTFGVGAELGAGDEGSTTYVEINGDLSASSASAQGQVYGAYVSASGSTSAEADPTASDLLVNGNVTATGSEYAIGLYMNATNNAEAAAVVVGDVTSDGVGLKVDGNTDATVNVLVDGTLSGEKGSLRINTYDSQNNTAVSENVNVYVWELDTTQTFTEDTQLDANQQEEFLLNNVHYIIHFADKKQADKVTLDGAQALASEEEEEEDGVTCQYANEADEIIVKGKKNSKVIGAYYGEEKVELQKNAEGNYVLVIPRGGGVLLTIDLQMLAAQNRIKAKTEDGKAEMVIVSTRRFAFAMDDIAEFVNFRVENGQAIFTNAEGVEMTLEILEDGSGVLSYQLASGETVEMIFTAKDVTRLLG